MMPPEEKTTASDVRYGAKMLAVSEAIGVLEERSRMIPFSGPWLARRVLLKTYAGLMAEKITAHYATQGET